jgi:hypothetical protein
MLFKKKTYILGQRQIAGKKSEMVGVYKGLVTVKKYEALIYFFLKEQTEI